MSGYGINGAYGLGSYKGYFDNSLTEGMPNRINRTSGRCIRLALEPTQGVGWSIYGVNDHWVWPEPAVQPFDVFNESDQPIRILLDEEKGKFYQISTRNGPVGSGLVKVFVDREDQYGGYEIPTEVRFPEHVGQEERDRLSLEDSHAYIRPQEPENKGNSDYTTEGYRKAFSVDYGYLKDGEQTEFVTTREIPFNGDIAYTRRKEARRFQGIFKTTTSEYKLHRANMKYLMKPKIGSATERQLSEHTWQDEYADPEFWISRGYAPETDLATGMACSGNYFAVEDGPDGKESALAFALTTGLQKTLHFLTGDFTLQFGIKGISGVVLTMATGNLSIIVNKILNDYYLTYNDAGNSLSQKLGWDGTGWNLLKIVRKDNSLLISENGQLIQTLFLTNITQVGGTMDIMSGQIGSLYDLRIYETAVSDSAFLYYYRDVLENKGDSVCPIW